MTPDVASNKQAQSRAVTGHQQGWNPAHHTGFRKTPRRNRYASEQRSHEVDWKVSEWTNSRAKRLLDISAAAALLLLLAPLLCVLYCVVRLGSRGPVIFNQERVGKNNSRFIVHKFRTMIHDPKNAAYRRPQPGDSRLTRQGAALRKYKLDELPQLINIIRGEMSFVGPRPKLPELHLGPLPCRPGLTGRASVAFAAEALLVKEVPEHLHEGLHTSLITPIKLQLDLDYMRDAYFWSDLGIVLQTILRRGSYRDLSTLHARSGTLVESA